MPSPQNHLSRGRPVPSIVPTARRVRLLGCATALGLLALLPTDWALAQASPGVAVILPREGSRVRVQQYLGGVRPPKRMTGTFVATQADSIRIVQHAGDTSVLAISSLDYLDISLYRRRKVLSSVGAGVLIGSSSLALISALSHPDSGCTPSEFCLLEFSRTDAALLGGILGAVGGAVVGGIVGALRNADAWQRVPLSQLGQRVSIRPQFSRSRGAAVEWRF
jgi:hypothetical protein